MQDKQELPVVLCVDDEPVGLKIRSKVLQNRGYKVLTALNGEEALSSFSEEIDIVLLDYMLPKMDGGMVAAKMKQQKPAIPILLLSAYVDLPKEVLAHVDKHIVKGEGMEVLLTAIRELLASSRPATDKTPAPYKPS